MKVTKSNLQKMASDLQVIIDHVWPNCKDKFLQEYILNNVGVRFHLWHKVYANRKYTNDNANVSFVNGQRLLSYDDNFEYYVDDTNDNTIDTAFRYIFEHLIQY